MTGSFKTTIIETPRLRLVPITHEHGEFVWDMRSHYEIYRWTMAGVWLEKDQARAWIQNALDTPSNYNFIIELRPEQEAQDAPSDKPSQSSPSTAIGSIGIHNTQEIGYMFHPSFWGKGYATEALCCFLDTAWKMLPELQVLVGLTDAENEGSMAVLRKCGFVEVEREEYENVTMGKRIGVKFECRRI